MSALEAVQTARQSLRRICVRLSMLTDTIWKIKIGEEREEDGKAEERLRFASQPEYHAAVNNVAYG
ncbi:hypothetical protein ANO14919_131560 [Xylariales sp. No.14919]|nr:hypothetical protein ANO14919_131560 [Xylariales sp. No.14919]